MDRRTLLTGGTVLAAAAFTKEAAARAKLGPATAEDTHFMQLAINQAKNGDFPFGAIIVREGKVLALGQNTSKRDSDPTAHAEMVAIRSFLTGHDPEEFAASTIYASGEPCPMCMGAIIWCRFKRLVYAASIAQLSTRMGQIEITSRQIANAASFAEIEITGGVLATDSVRLFDKK